MELAFSDDASSNLPSRRIVSAGSAPAPPPPRVDASVAAEDRALTRVAPAAEPPDPAAT